MERRKKLHAESLHQVLDFVKEIQEISVLLNEYAKNKKVA